MNIENVVNKVVSHLGPNSTLWLAYSGGLDSSVLLHILSQRTLPLKAIYVNHQLSSNSHQWQRHCESIASELNVPIICESVTVKNCGRGIEHAAREKRYEVFSRLTKKNDVILFAHHRDDLVETVMFRLARGAGLNGLIGIKQQRSLGSATLLRPLLSYTKEEIQEYALTHGIRWVEDESNQDDVFDRNFIRNRILPLFRERWPQFASRVANASAWLSEAQSLLDDYADEDLIKISLRRERLGESINMDAFAQLSFVRQKHVIRRWCEKSAYSLPDTVVLESIPDLVAARNDASPLISWGNCELRRYQSRIYLIPKLPHVESLDLLWSGAAPLALPDGGCLSSLDYIENVALRVRYRRAGERCKPEGRRFSQSLKKLMQEYKLEPWLRDRAPVVCVGDEVLAVADLFSCIAAQGRESQPFRFQWEYTVTNLERPD